MAVGEIQAHANGIAGLAIMTTTSSSTTTTGARRGRRSTVLDEEGEETVEDMEDAGGLLVTCGDAEGVVKIWDYTHVEDGSGSCGRYVYI